jgi:hypothetical protein
MPKITSEQLDDLVAAWHDCEQIEKQSVISWMEMTESQYFHWVKTDEPPEMSDKQYERAIAKWNKYCSIEGSTR